jgi:hypothetical protein
MNKDYSGSGRTEKPSTEPQAQKLIRHYPFGPKASEMTLRDRFAEDVMLALLNLKPSMEVLERIPTIAYKTADAMIQARNA